MGIPKLTDAELKKTVDVWQNNGQNTVATAKKLKITESTLRRRLIKAEKRGLLKREHPKTPKKAGLSLKDFQSKYDHSTKTREAIRQAVKDLSEDLIVGDAEFRLEHCKVSNASGWRQIADEPEFKHYQFICDNKVWWANKATVQEAIRRVGKARTL